MRNIIIWSSYLFFLHIFCEFDFISGECVCPQWIINFTTRRYFCGREFRGQTGCNDNAVYQCSKKGSKWVGQDTTICGGGRERKLPYCELNCHGSSNADKCDCLCVDDKKHADDSFYHLYEHSGQLPWLNGRSLSRSHNGKNKVKGAELPGRWNGQKMKKSKGDSGYVPQAFPKFVMEPPGKWDDELQTEPPGKWDRKTKKSKGDSGYVPQAFPKFVMEPPGRWDDEMQTEPPGKWDRKTKKSKGDSGYVPQAFPKFVMEPPGRWDDDAKTGKGRSSSKGSKNGKKG